jgi:predicted helicase
MSKVLINQYYTNIQRATQYGKSRNETSIRNHTWNLLNAYAHKKNYEVITEMACFGTKGKNVYPDGVLKNNWGLDIGYWESKDEKDKIDDEIDAKIKKGYPLNNILFEDTQTAVLYQYGQVVMRVPVNDPERLDMLLDQFIEYKSETVHKFEKALDNFKIDIPVIIETLRKRIEQTGDANPEYLRARDIFLELCKTVINPEITLADIREMMIQHLLTSDIFNKIFDEPEFHRHNSVARELENLIGTLFSYGERRNLLNSVEHFYDAINSTAASITDHHEKQKFLKVLYENFYKVYNPKAADRLGVVYTPNEIVEFMIHSTDYLLEKHFGKTLADPGVEILDPAVGTGTFICDIIEHIPKQRLVNKYKNELHANEVAILPYYIANLNIEYAFKQKMGYFEEFPNICFVDTLDNTEGLSYIGQQHSLFGLSSENAERINRQNQKKISVIIGNPPYNANQKNENENNKNREYPFIDKRIKDTFVKLSAAQKTKAYDMYSRFFRWSMDRINNEGIIAFISNSSFIGASGFDGFRKTIANEFSDCYIIDLAGDLRTDKEENIFGITVGVCISFLIKRKSSSQSCGIYYLRVPLKRKIEKIEWLKTNKIETIIFEKISPDKNNQWLEIAENDFEELLPLVVKGRKENSLINEYSNGLSTNRDEWVYDFSKNELIKKSNFFIEEYNHEVRRWLEYKQKNNYIDIKAESNPVIDSFLSERNLIKWSKMIKRDKLRKGKLGNFVEKDIRSTLYRPFVKQYLYFGYIPIDMRGSFPLFYPEVTSKNLTISISNSDRIKLAVIASKEIADLNIFSPAPIFSYSLYRISETGDRIVNISDWGLEQFRNYYPGATIIKEDIFCYVYGVLHDPAYRKKYELNLKREFPRIPFYNDFQKWSGWGKKLMDLHINFETVEPYNLEIIEKPTEKSPAELQREMFSEAAEPEPMVSYQPKIKVKLKADKETGVIEIDELTTIKGIPPKAWEYKLGNRSALEWILDQYKEKKPSDPTIAEKFNTYRFADYKDHVIDLLKRVCTVSVETMKIIRDMESDNSQN